MRPFFSVVPTAFSFKSLSLIMTARMSAGGRRCRSAALRTAWATTRQKLGVHAGVRQRSRCLTSQIVLAKQASVGVSAPKVLEPSFGLIRPLAEALESSLAELLDGVMDGEPAGIATATAGS